MEGIERIPINIWDDFYDDGYVPEGEQQKTYIYVEDTEIPQEKRRECLELLLKHLKTKLEKVKLEMFFYDSKVKYPHIIPEEHPHFHFERWEIRVEDLTHSRLDVLVDELNGLNLSLENIPFDIYSES